MIDKKEQLSAVLNAICNESDKRLYGYWNLKYNDVMDYLTDKSKNAPYYVTEYYKSDDYADKDSFKNTFYDYVVFDNLFIDFDADDDAGRTPTDSINEAIRVANGLKAKGLDVLVNYSGSKGAHMHILFNPIRLEHYDAVIKDFCQRIEKAYKVTLDSAVYGSIRRLKRIPCSKHNKTNNYGHFINFEDRDAINTTINNAEYSPYEIIDKGAKYYVPEVPDKAKNTAILEPIFKELDDIADAIDVESDDAIDYDVPDRILDDIDNEFLTKYKSLFYKGNRNTIAGAIIFMFKRCGWNDERILSFFKPLVKASDIEMWKEIKRWINWTNSHYPKIPGLTYFKKKVTESIEHKTALHGDDMDAVINDYVNYFESAFKIDNSIYKVPAGLDDTKYQYDDNALYCLIGLDYYLAIKRAETSFLYSIVKFDKSAGYVILSSNYSAKKSITTDDNARLKALETKVKQINKRFNIDICNGTPFDDILSDIAIELSNVSNYEQITAEFNVYKEMQSHANVTDDDADTTDDASDLIEWRKHPTYDKDIAEKVYTRISNFGLLTYLEMVLQDVHLGTKRNIYRKVLSAFNIMRGKGSYLFQTTAHAGVGKSKEDEVAFLTIIPDKYIFRKNQLTLASFTRYDKNYFDRMIIYFGDFGSKKAFAKIEDVFDVFKILITEHKFSRDIAERTSANTNYENVSLDLEVESIGGVYSAPDGEFVDGDSQLESRTVKSTPETIKDDELMEFIGHLNFVNSKKAKAYKKAESELKEFQEYLLSLVDNDMVIINPYISVFRRYAKKGTDVSIREFKQLLEQFDAYCLLTNYDCIRHNEHIISSTKQLKEFFTFIALENALIPYQSDFINMLMGVGTQKELTLINRASENPGHPDAPLDDLNVYLNNALFYTLDHPTLADYDNINTWDDLSSQNEVLAVKKLLQLYKLGGRSSMHKENVFFRNSDVKSNYANYPAFRNVEDLSKTMQRLYKLGYADKLEYKDKNSNQNIYYLTDKCASLTEEFKFTDDDLLSALEFLSDEDIEVDADIL